MSQQQDLDTSDVFNIVQEKIIELQWKTKALEESQQELLQVRQELLHKDVTLEDRKKMINDLKMQLATANQVIDWIEKEKAKFSNERLQLQINCDAALKERESLLEQAHAAKLENLTLKLNLKTLTENLAANEAAKKVLEVSLLETQERFSQANNYLQSNMTKLEREHQLLLKSVESTAQLNKRLQTVGLCTHAIYTKKNEEIQRLQEELALKAHVNIQPSQIYLNDVINSYSSDQLDAKAVLEQVRADTEKDKEMDKEIAGILAEFESG